MIISLAPDFLTKPERLSKPTTRGRRPNISQAANTPPAIGRNVGTAPPAMASIPTPAPAAQGVDAGLAAALHGRVGCAHPDAMGLSAAERRDCERLARGRGRAFENAQFGIDPRTRAIFDAGAKRDVWFQQPFLAEKPTKGCRPRVTEENLPTNAGRPAQDWTTGVSCGAPF